MNEHIIGLAIWSSLLGTAILTSPLFEYFMLKKWFDKPTGGANLFVYGMISTMVHILYVYKFIEAVINDTPYLR